MFVVATEGCFVQQIIGFPFAVGATNGYTAIRTRPANSDYFAPKATGTNNHENRAPHPPLVPCVLRLRGWDNRVVAGEGVADVKTKTERLKTIRDMLRSLKRRKQDAKDEIRVLDSAIVFYEAMRSEVLKERTP